MDPLWAAVWRTSLRPSHSWSEDPGLGPEPQQCENTSTENMNIHKNYEISYVEALNTDASPKLHLTSIFMVIVWMEPVDQRVILSMGEWASHSACKHWTFDRPHGV